MTAEKAAKIAEKARKKAMRKDDKEAKKAIKKAAKEGLNCVDVDWISSGCEKDLKSKGFDIEEHRPIMRDIYYTILWGKINDSRGNARPTRQCKQADIGVCGRE